MVKYFTKDTHQELSSYLTQATLYNMQVKKYSRKNTNI